MNKKLLFLLPASLLLGVTSCEVSDFISEGGIYTAPVSSFPKTYVYIIKGMVNNK